MKKIMIIVLSIVLAAVLIFGAMIFLGTRPISKDDAIAAMGKMTEAQLGKKNITQAIVYVNSGEYEIDQHFAYGQMDGEPIDAKLPFHTASVGKAFTATLIGTLIDEGKMSLDDLASAYLGDDILDGLFEYEGVDYSHEVTIAQLLSHTSGAADYFDDKTIGEKSMKELIVENPDTFWTPNDLLDFSRNYQKTVGKPGEKYHYSDTGYILLGLIIESVSGQSFHAMLHERIFDPLEMDDTYLMFYSEPKNEKRPIADIWLGGVNIKDYQSLSIDWAGGGMISTADDLAKFVRSLNQYEIVSLKTLDSMYQFDNYKFINGIHYGYGYMEYHFGEFMPTLKSMPKYVGHMGVLGTQMFYDKSTDTVYISSCGSTDAPSVSVQTMIKIISTLDRIE
ncbi:MAG: serine hydrolase domain-containing protein [Eubacteriales bacterium]